MIHFFQKRRYGNTFIRKLATAIHDITGTWPKEKRLDNSYVLIIGSLDNGIKIIKVVGTRESIQTIRIEAYAEALVNLAMKLRDNPVSCWKIIEAMKK